jgi:hypothetical protein
MEIGFEEIVRHGLDGFPAPGILRSNSYDAFLESPTHALLETLLIEGMGSEIDSSALLIAIHFLTKNHERFVGEIASVCRYRSLWQKGEEPSVLSPSAAAIRAAADRTYLDLILSPRRVSLQEAEKKALDTTYLLSSYLVARLYSLLPVEERFNKIFSDKSAISELTGNSFSDLYPFIKGCEWPSEEVLARSIYRALPLREKASENSTWERKVFASICAAAWPAQINLYLAATPVNRRSYDQSKAWEALYPDIIT